MAYDEALAARIRSVLAHRENVTERKMFGGVAFMVGDRMAVGVIRDDLMVRVGPEAHDDALAPMRGMVYVSPAGIAADADLARWVEAGAAYAASQPPKRR
jgi:hypothetical protein